MNFLEIVRNSRLLDDFGTRRYVYQLRTNGDDKMTKTETKSNGLSHKMTVEEKLKSKNRGKK